MIRANTTTNIAPDAVVLIPKAVSKLTAILFACTPGSKSPVARIVAATNTKAYHLTPRPFRCNKQVHHETALDVSSYIFARVLILHKLILP